MCRVRLTRSLGGMDSRHGGAAQMFAPGSIVRFARLLLAGLAVSALWAGTAHAGEVRIPPAIVGSGQVLLESAPFCAADKPNGARTECPRTTIGAIGWTDFAGVTLTPVAPAAPAGHWRFVRWEDC